MNLVVQGTGMQDSGAPRDNPIPGLPAQSRNVEASVSWSGDGDATN